MCQTNYFIEKWVLATGQHFIYLRCVQNVFKFYYLDIRLHQNYEILKVYQQLSFIFITHLIEIL